MTKSGDFLSSHRKWLVALIVCTLFWLIWYLYLANYIVYAIHEDGEWESVYRSTNHDKAKEIYIYLNAHKKEGVKHYILLDKEMGNSLISF